MKAVPRSVLWGLLTAVAVAIYFLPGATEAMQYDHAAVANGELWRLLTCHWTHWSADHLLWSGGAFAVLAFACHRLAPRRGLACVVLSAIVVGLAISCGTRLDQYRGLSGIDSALFTMVSVSCLIDSRAAGERGRTAGFAVLLLALAGKLAYECLTGQALFVNADATGVPPVPLAHAAGAATGVLMAVIRPCRPSHRSSPHGCPGVHVVVRH